MKKKAIISFSHTNYCVRSSGTEKFIRGISKLLQQQKYVHINFFSFYNSKGIIKEKLIGVNFNDKFYGIYKYCHLIRIIDSLCEKYDLEIISVHLQHLQNHDLAVLYDCIQFLNVPVFIFVHDYFLVCSRLNLIDSNNQFCGVSSPYEKKCQKCSYFHEGLTHFHNMTRFLYGIGFFIEKLITPSEYVTQRVKKIFPKLADKIVTRPHLTFDEKRKFKEIHIPVKMAFAGAQISSKGYYVWKRIVEQIRSLCPDAYDLYYFGNGNEHIDGVTNVYVSSAVMGDDAMKNELARFQIDCAFVWPIWAETYNYIYYELGQNGIYVITNTISGNVYDEIQHYKNGKAFGTISDCIDYLVSNKGVLFSDLSYFYNKGAVFFDSVQENSDLTYLVKQNKGYSVNNSFYARKPRKTLIYNTIYKIKYHTYI